MRLREGGGRLKIGRKKTGKVKKEKGGRKERGEEEMMGRCEGEVEMGVVGWGCQSKWW